MITKVDLDSGPIAPGERRPITAWADTSLRVGIKCFTNTPPPPGYRPCAACGTIDIQSGETTYVTADRALFIESGGGYVEVILEDQKGDRRDYRLAVLSSGTSRSFAAEA